MKKLKAARKPCKEMNIDLSQIINPVKVLQKPRVSTFLSAQQSKRNSAENSFSLSPSRKSIPLTLVSPCSVNFSKELQARLRNRSCSKSSQKQSQETVFTRNVQWKEQSKKKILSLKMEKDKNELIGCTFTPKVNRSHERTFIDTMRVKYLQNYMFDRQLSFLNEEPKENEEKKNVEIEDINDELIEKSFLKVTRTLDNISKQILNTIKNSRTDL